MKAKDEGLKALKLKRDAPAEGGGKKKKLKVEHRKEPESAEHPPTLDDTPTPETKVLKPPKAKGKAKGLAKLPTEKSPEAEAALETKTTNKLRELELMTARIRRARGIIGG